MKTSLAVIGVLLVLAGCSSTRGIDSVFDYNPDADFTPYQTFSWVSENAYVQGNTSIATSSENYIHVVLRQELEEKGFVFTEDRDSANFLVSFTVGSRTDLNLSVIPEFVQVNTTWGGNYWGPPTTVSYNVSAGRTLQVKEYQEGQLAIDVIDVGLGEPVWHGTATREITLKNRRDPKPLIDKAVSEILQDFPPSS